MCQVLVELIKDSGQATVNSCYGKGSTRKTRPGCFLFSYQKQKGVAVFSTLRTNYCSTTSTYPVHSLGWRQDAKDGSHKIMALQEYGLTKPPSQKIIVTLELFLVCTFRSVSIEQQHTPSKLSFQPVHHMQETLSNLGFSDVHNCGRAKRGLSEAASDIKREDGAERRLNGGRNGPSPVSSPSHSPSTHHSWGSTAPSHSSSGFDKVKFAIFCQLTQKCPFTRSIVHHFKE